VKSTVYFMELALSGCFYAMLRPSLRLTPFEGALFIFWCHSSFIYPL